MTTPLLMKTEIFFKKSIIDDNVDSENIKKLIIRATEVNLYDILGTRLYNKICTDAAANTITGYYKTLLDDYIQTFLTYWVESYAPSELSYRITNKGTVQKNSQDSNQASDLEISRLTKAKESMAQSFGDKMVKYIKNNLIQFPEYQSIVEPYGSMPKNSYPGSIWLGRKKNCGY